MDPTCRLPGALPERLRAALVADAGRRRFRAPDPRAGGWFAMASGTERHPAAHDAEAFLTRLAHEHGFGGFRPNEASFQRYEPGGRGLPPHRDQRYYVGCIVIATLEGEATFAVHRSRSRDDVAAEWTTTPGEVVLLAGWHPTAPDDLRPHHRVDAPTSDARLMFQLRHRLTPTSPGWEALTPAERDEATTLATPPRGPASGGASESGDREE